MKDNEKSVKEKVTDVIVELELKWKNSEIRDLEREEKKKSWNCNETKEENGDSRKDSRWSEG